MELLDAALDERVLLVDRSGGKRAPLEVVVIHVLGLDLLPGNRRLEYHLDVVEVDPARHLADETDIDVGACSWECRLAGRCAASRSCPSGCACTRRRSSDRSRACRSCRRIARRGSRGFPVPGSSGDSSRACRAANHRRHPGVTGCRCVEDHPPVDVEHAPHAIRESPALLLVDRFPAVVLLRAHAVEMLELPADRLRSVPFFE